MESTVISTHALAAYASTGRVSASRDGLVVFHPTGTNYELYLACDPAYAGLVGRKVNALIIAQARKVWTVPSGGNFISPIFGPPKIVQGRVRLVEGNRLILHAGTDFVIDLPVDDSAIELAHGAFGRGTMINCTLQPGAKFEII